MAAIYVGGGIMAVRVAPNAFGLAIAMVAAIPATLLALTALRSRLTIEGDRLELRTALRARTVRRDDIDGLQRIQGRGGRSTRVVLKHNRGALLISSAFSGNDDLEEWLKGLPDIDVRNAARIEAMIDAQAGSRTGARTHDQLLERADNWMLVLNAATGLACAAAVAPSHPISTAGRVALLLILPVGLFLIHRFPLLFTVFKAKVDPRAELGFVILGPGLGLLLSELYGGDPSHLVDETRLTIWFVPTYLILSGSVAAIAWRSPARWGIIAPMLIFGIAYAGGVVDVADTLPDDSAPSFFRTWVVAKHEVHWRRGTDYDLRVAPWGPMPYADDIGVSANTYVRSAFDDPVCIALHRGFLRAAWYTRVSCAGPLVRDAVLSVPDTASEASALLPDAQRAAAIHPRDAHAQFVLGQCLVLLKRYDEALPPLLAAEKLDTTDAWTHNSIGWALIEQGRFAEAVPHLRAAVALDSTYSRAQGNLAWAYVKLNDLPDAERASGAVVRLEPQNGDAAYQYAWVLERLHGARAAEAEVARALQLEPTNGEIQAYAGYVYRLEGRFADARQHDEIATRLRPNDGTAWAELGATDYLMNDRAAAAAAFARVARINPGYIWSRPDLLRMWRDVAPGRAR